MGQLRYDIFKNPFDFYYFNRNFHEVGIQNFSARVANTSLFIFVISLYIRIKFKLEKQKYILCLFFGVFIVLLNLLFVAGVMRVSQLTLPFLLFYSLESIFQKYKK